MGTLLLARRLNAPTTLRGPSRCGRIGASFANRIVLKPTELALFALARRRWRTFSAAALGVAAGFVAARWGLAPGASVLIGWNIAAFVYLTATGWTFLRDDAGAIRARAAVEDENRGVIMTLVLSAVGVSFAAIIVALRESKGGHGGATAALAGLSVMTLILSWLVVQVLFTLHYAHRYFADADGDGADDGGVKFAGDPPASYVDFFYMAVCMGATFQVSDFNLTNSRFRALVTVHALVAFLFNTMVLSLGVGIVGGLLAQ